MPCSPRARQPERPGAELPRLGYRDAGRARRPDLHVRRAAGAHRGAGRRTSARHRRHGDARLVRRGARHAAAGARETPAETPTWNWARNAPDTAAFWPRRMAQETAVHRWDAQSAAGHPRADLHVARVRRGERDDRHLPGRPPRSGQGGDHRHRAPARHGSGRRRAVRMGDRARDHAARPPGTRATRRATRCSAAPPATCCSQRGSGRRPSSGSATQTMLEAIRAE